MQYKNPIVPTSKTHNTSDPYILFHDGFYYHCYFESDGVYLAKTDDLTKLSGAEKYKVFSTPETGFGSNWYAPELHQFDDTWYIYGAAETYKGKHEMYAVQLTAKDPIGAYSNMQKVMGIGDMWSLDGTVLRYNGVSYLIWSYGSKIVIAPLISPTEVSSMHTTLIECTCDFEKKEGRIIEGPAILQRNGKVYLVYSTNDSRTDEYCMGVSIFRGGDILQAESWVKVQHPIFEKTENIFGPGHCSFTRMENDDYMVYHANLVSSSGWYGRSIWLQKIEWDENDEPIFGQPHF